MINLFKRNIEVTQEYVTYLENEIDKLKEQNEFLMKRENKCQILEQRIKEALKYIESLTLQRVVYDKLIEILKGDSNEN